METLDSLLEELDSGLEGGPPHKPAPKPKDEKKGLWWKILIAVLLLLLILGGILLWWWSSQPAMDATTQYWFDKAAEDGTLEGKTPAELQEMLDSIMAEGMVNVTMNSVVIFEDGQAEGSLGVENIEGNRYYCRVILTKDDDGAVLYESDGLKPGQFIDKIKLNQDLPAGEYACTATEIITDPETLEDIGQVQVQVKVIVKS